MRSCSCSSSISMLPPGRKLLRAGTSVQPRAATPEQPPGETLDHPPPAVGWRTAKLALLSSVSFLVPFVLQMGLDYRRCADVKPDVNILLPTVRIARWPSA